MPPAIAAALAAATGLAATSTAIVIASNVIAFGISVVAMAVLGRQSTPKMDASFSTPTTDAYNANKQIVRGSAVNRKIVYGEAKVGGLLTYVNTTDLKGWNREGNSDLFMVIAVAPHPIQSYQDFFVNDKSSEWFTNSANWVDKNDIVTVIWHRNMNGCIDDEGGNTMWWKGSLNGVEMGGIPWGTDGENFYNTLRAKGFDVTQSFVDAGTHSTISKYVEPEKQTSTNWAPVVTNPTEPEPQWTAKVPVYDFELGEYVTKEVPATQITALDGSNSWIWEEEVYNSLTEQDEKVVHNLEPEQIGFGQWKYSQYNETTGTFDTLTQEQNPALPYIPGIDGKSGFTEFASEPNFGSTGSSCKVIPISASLDEMPGILSIVPYKGSLNQQADPNMVKMFPDYTTAFKGRGVSYFTTQLFYDYQALPNGIPAYSTAVMGKNNLIDPRDINDDWILNVTQDVRNAVGKYSTNAAVVIMDYLISEFGLNIPLTEIDLDSFVIAANICDEPVELVAAQSVMIGARSVATIEGNRTAVYAPGHGLSSNNDGYIVQGDKSITSQIEVVDADNFIYQSGFLDEGVAGSVRLQQRRYTINGVIDTGTQPSGVIDTMLMHTGGGSIVYDNGKYSLNVGFYKLPVADIDEDWLLSDVKVQPRATRDQLFNAVRGTYIDRENEWEATDYKPWSNPTYCQEDNKGEVCGPTDYIYAPVDFPLCIEHNRARRLAKIYLNRARQALVINVTCNLRAFKLDTGDNITLTLAALGFIKKEFEVINWTLTTSMQVELVLQETASEIYDWNNGEYVEHDLAENTQLPSLTWPNAFEDVELSTAAYFDTGGVLAEQIIVKVIMNESYDYVTYANTEIEYRDILKPNDPWHVASKGKSLIASISNIEMSTYAVRVRGTSSSSPPTPWYIKDITAQGAGSIIFQTEMPKPIDPAVYFGIKNNNIAKLKFTTTLNGDDWIDQDAPPEFMLFMYSAEESRNQVTTADNGATELTISNTDIIGTGELPVVDTGANLPNKIQLTNFDEPMSTGVDLTGMWWLRIRQQDGTTFSIFTKVNWYDENFLYLNRELYLDGDASKTPYTPVATDTIEWVQVAFHDVREDEFKLGSIVDENGNYEVIQWEDLQYTDPNFQLIGITRQVEDSALVNATDKTFSYFPAPGPGTTIIPIPASSFNFTGKIEGGTTYDSEYQVDIDIPDSLNWASMTCCFARNTVKDGVPVVVRSPIVFPIYRGEI